MKSDNLLYEIFSQELGQPGLIANESAEEFADRVVTLYVESLKQSGFSIPIQVFEEVESDLCQEVLDMTRKKTYGFHNLEEFRKSQKS